MKSKTLVAAVCALAAAGGLAASLPARPPATDLVIEDVEILQYPGDGAEVTAKGAQPLRLEQYRSYRVVAHVRNRGARILGAFNVVARSGNGHKEIGRARVGDTGRLIYACFDLFPGSCPPGQTELRIVVDANDEIAESDETDISNIWKHKATFVRAR